MMVKSNPIFREITYREGKAGVFLKVGIREKGRKRREFAMVYVLLRTKSWKREEHENMLKDTKKYVKELLKK